MAKVGRKRYPYLTSWGESIDGLARLTDRRWVDQDDRAHPWVSADEREAIKEFRKRRARRGREQVDVQLARVRWAQLEAELHRAFGEEEGEVETRVRIHPDGTASMSQMLPSQPVWDAFARLLRENPRLAAERTGIKQLAWLDDLDPPPPPLALQEVRRLYESKRFKDPNEGLRSLTYWDEFCEAIAPAAEVKQVKPVHIRSYYESVAAGGLSPKTLRNRFAKIRCMLNHAFSLLPPHRPAIQNLKTEFGRICKAGSGQVTQADPIDPDDFAALYEAADLRWRSILLCMLNFAMHPKETGEIRKGELNLKLLELRSYRTKTSVARVAKVWPETAAAVRAYQETQKGNPVYRESPCLFLTSLNKPYGHAGLTQYLGGTLRPRAEKLAGRTLQCTLDCIRDGAQNAADDGGADTIHTEMLMGHALPGVMGSYKKRTPAKTAESVRCIHEHYRIAELVARYKSAPNPKQ